MQDKQNKGRPKKAAESTSDVQDSVIHILVGSLRVRTWIKCFHRKWEYQERGGRGAGCLACSGEVLETVSSSVAGCLHTSKPLDKLLKSISNKFYHKITHIDNLSLVVYDGLKRVLLSC